jgi:cob(I)alamin adenosyltransferase
MGSRLTKIYTRTGDDGSTGLTDGSRVPKHGLRVEAMGEVDETNSVLGLVLASTLPETVREALLQVQHDLFDLGAELSMPGHSILKPDRVGWLEQTLDGFNAGLPPLKEFILPGGGQAAAMSHLARAVCRRAERCVAALAAQEEVSETARAYLNRLSDLLFVLSRVIAREAGEGEVYWRSRRLQGE